MADAKKCDICGKFYATPLGSLMNETGYQLLYCGGLISTIAYDLCHECKKELTAFVNDMKEKHHD